MLEIGKIYRQTSWGMRGAPYYTYFKVMGKDKVRHHIKVWNPHQCNPTRIRETHMIYHGYEQIEEVPRLFALVKFPELLEAR